MSVILAGTGCGHPGTMTLEVKQALEAADLIIGARRLLEGLPPECKGERRPAIYARDICGLICARLEEAGQERNGQEENGQEEAGRPRICVAFSGDSGFYSGTRSLLPLLEEAGIRAKVLPGISSIQVLSARLGRPWQDWRLVSAHGTDCDAVTAVMEGKPVFFLTGGTLSPAELCGQLTEAGLGCLEVTVGERLTYPDEQILTGRAAAFAERTFAPLSVMLAEPPARMDDLTPGIEDGMFIRGSVPMTKETVRAAILGQLQVRPSDTVWDVGAGTGSVSVELAMKARTGRVHAVERNAEGIGLIRQNREKFGVWNLCVTEGDAPAALQNLPAPDRVFIGGSDGQLREIIGIALDKNPNVRICVSAIVLETMQETVSVMAEKGLDVRIIQVAVSTGRRIGSGGKTRHMLMAGNPIFLVTGQNTAEAEAGCCASVTAGLHEETGAPETDEIIKEAEAAGGEKDHA